MSTQYLKGFTLYTYTMSIDTDCVRYYIYWYNVCQRLKMFPLAVKLFTKKQKIT